MDQTKLEAIADRLARVAQNQAPLSDLLALGPKELAAILSLAIAKMRIGRNDEAARIMRGLVALDADNPLFHQYLGLSLERASDLDGAIGAYSTQIERLQKRDDVAADLCQAFSLRCRAFAMKGELSSAAADLSAARRFVPGNDVVLRQELEQLERVVGGAR